MEIRMSLQARQELLNQVRVRYQSGNRKGKIKILDGFIAATGYQRKYAIGLLRKNKLTKNNQSLQTTQIWTRCLSSIIDVVGSRQSYLLKKVSAVPPRTN